MSAKHFTGEPGEAGLGITHGGGWVAVYGAEVALAVDEGVAQGKGLRETDHGVVDGGVAVRGGSCPSRGRRLSPISYTFC